MSDSEHIIAVFLLHICVSHFTESRLNPDEDRVIKYLFDGANQKHNFRVTPVHSAHEVMDIKFAINILKIINLVNTVCLILLVICAFSHKPFCRTINDLPKHMYSG